MSDTLPRRSGHRDIARASCLVASGAITVAHACEGKTRYERERYAKAAARELERKVGRQVSTYLCAFCGGHHLTKVKYGEGEE